MLVFSSEITLKILLFWGFTIEKVLTFPTANYHIQAIYYTQFQHLSIFTG